MREALRRLLGRAGFLAFAVLVGAAVGVIADARADTAGEGIRPAHSTHQIEGTARAVGTAETLQRPATGR
jgi:hypothetical protein